MHEPFSEPEHVQVAALACIHLVIYGLSPDIGALSTAFAEKESVSLGGCRFAIINLLDSTPSKQCKDSSPAFAPWQRPNAVFGQYQAWPYCTSVVIQENFE